MHRDKQCGPYIVQEVNTYGNVNGHSYSILADQTAETKQNKKTTSNVIPTGAGGHGTYWQRARTSHWIGMVPEQLTDLAFSTGIKPPLRCRRNLLSNNGVGNLGVHVESMVSSGV